MCIIPIGRMDPNNPCGDCFKPQFAPSEKSKKLISTMYTVLIVNLAVMFSKMLLMGLAAGFQDAFSCMILYCGIARIDYCQMVFYMIFNAQLVLEIFVALGFAIQKKLNSGGKIQVPESFVPKQQEIGKIESFYWAYSGFLFIFYMVSIFYAFQAYKEFKGQLEDLGGSQQIEANNILGYGTLREGGASSAINYQRLNQDENEDSAPARHRPFAG